MGVWIYDRCRTWAARHPWRVLALVSAIAAVHAFVRLGNEMVGVAEESLFANTALEIVRGGDWVGTTLLGHLDYYNSKPPLHVWLVALSFKAFGVGLIPLRLSSAFAAWASVLVLMAWSRRAFGTGVAAWSGLVLATSQGFFWVHSGRSANADALLALLILLVAVTLWAGVRRPWRRAWLGPLLAAVFLTKGFAVAMPLLMVAAMELSAWRDRRWPTPLQALPLGVAAVSATVPVAAWTWARWQVDQWRFFAAMWNEDVVARSTSALEGHAQPVWYYLYVVQRNHPEWLAVVAIALLLAPRGWAWWRDAVSVRGADVPSMVLLASWGTATFILPSMMSTKVAWYANPGLPLLALGSGWVIDRSLAAAPVRGAGSWRAPVLLATIALAMVVLETRVWWQSYTRLDVSRSVQSLLLAEGDRLRGHDVFGEHWAYPELFLVRAHRAHERSAPGASEFLHSSRVGDYLLSVEPVEAPGVELVGRVAGGRLYRRVRDGER